MKMICFNPNCRDASEQFKKAWRCRNGDFAPLCHRCAATFEQGRFCHTFHLDAAGWRNCESCGKPIHCGCIVSIHDYILLDAGGVDCMACARKKIVMATNQIWPSSFSLPIPDIPKDVSVKNSSQIAAPSGNLGYKGKPFDMWNTSAAQSGLNPRMEYEVDGVNQIPGECSTLVLETKRFEYPYDRVNDLNHLVMNSPNLNASVDMDIGSHSLHRDEMSQNGLQGMTYETDPNTHVNISLRHISLKEGPSNPQFSAVPCLPANKANGLNSFSATQTQHQALSPQVVEQSTANSQNGMDSFGETQKRIGRLQVDPRGRSQLLPRYWPRITDQELQQISGDSNSVITPLFEKMLSASDAGKVGRLVLPKKCAEAYFPTITHSEGLPLKVQDAKGKEWVLNFRFWPNNNSRMYVLEGVTPCIQSMQLQAGDTVTFSRIDPEGKLVMGFRKAASVPPLDQDKQSLMMGSDVSKISEVNASDPAGSWHANDRLKSFTPRRRKPRALGAKSKRLGMEHEDLMELKLTWEEALGLLRPPVDNPNVVVVEGHAFEEYEEAPILGKPTIITTDQVGEKIQWIQCEDCSKWRKLPISALLPPRWTCSANLWDPKRSLCSSAQEITSKQLEEIVSSSKTASALTKTKPAEKNMGNIEVSEGLNNLANLGEDDSLPSIQATTRHPRHRIGCTCIVCIQAPIGKGPKHKATCICNVCQAVKRRKLSLMKRKSEKDTEFARKKLEQLQLPGNPELIDDISMTVSLDPCQKVIGSVDSADDPDDKKLFTPLVGQIDLNIQPEREDAQLPVSCSNNIVKLGSGNHKLFPIWCGKASSAQCDVNLVVNEDDGIEHDLSSGANKGVDPTCISKPADSSD